MARSPRVSFYPGNTSRSLTYIHTLTKDCNHHFFRFKQSVEWDFSDAESVLSEEVTEEDLNTFISKESSCFSSQKYLTGSAKNPRWRSP